MMFNPTARDSKILNIKFDNDQIPIKTTKRIRISSNQYANQIELPKDIADRFYKSSSVKILIPGEWKDEIEIIPSQLKKFRVIYDAIYN